MVLADRRLQVEEFYSKDARILEQKSGKIPPFSLDMAPRGGYLFSFIVLWRNDSELQSAITFPRKNF